MKKHKPLSTSYSVNNKEQTRLLTKVTSLLESSIPNNILGMLATAKEKEQTLIFYERWSLVIHGKNNYDIYDLYTKETVYKHVALFSSALNIVFALNTDVHKSAPKEDMIYELDQEYFRCLENIKFYKQKTSTVAYDLLPLFAARLTDDRARLQEIKTKLSKIN